MYVLHYQDEVGKRRRRVVGHDKRVAEKVRAQIISERDMALSGLRPMAGAEKSLEEITEAWIAAKRPDWAPGHLKRTLQCVEAFNKAHPGMMVKALGVRIAREHIRSRRAVGGLSKRSANMEVGAVKAALNWALSEELIPAHPLAAMKIEVPRGKDIVRNRRHLTDAEVKQLLAKAYANDTRPGRCYAAMLHSIIVTSARFDETAGLLWRDIQDDRVCIRHETAKAKNERWVALTPGLLSRIEWMRNARADTAPGDFLFSGPNGRVRNKALWKFLGESLAAAKIPKVDPAGRTVDIHALRHTALTRWARSGVPFQIALYMSGITTPHVLTQVYTHFGQGDAIRLPDVR